MTSRIMAYIGCLAAIGCASTERNAELQGCLPEIWPDYIGVTIPAEIAPMNFNVEGVAGLKKVHVIVSGSKEGRIEAAGKWADFDEKAWHSLAQANKGGNLEFLVSALGQDGRWLSYEPFQMHVSEEPMPDYGITYRKIAPGYETFSKIGVYQRCLANFKEEAILEETTVHGQCLNCHYANRGNPEQFSLHVRGKHGGTLLKNQGQVKYLNTKTEQTAGNCTYGYWHPQGRYCAYSLNRIYQNFYVGRRRVIEPWDAVSDLAVLDTHTDELLLDPRLTTDDCETTPAFSADGSLLYFCKANKVAMPGEYKDLRYSLCSIGFDPAAGRYGEKVDTVVCADSIGKSVSLPRPSYDGRYLMYCVTDYGTTPINRPESDLWIMDLRTGQHRKMEEVNSEETDAYHNWSSQGGWFLFGSKREDSLYSLVYFSLVDDQGHATKPFLLPQRNPKKYYGESLYSFNAPDFTTAPVKLDLREVGSLVMDKAPVRASVRSHE